MLKRGCQEGRALQPVSDASRPVFAFSGALPISVVTSGHRIARVSGRGRLRRSGPVKDGGRGGTTTGTIF